MQESEARKVYAERCANRPTARISDLNATAWEAVENMLRAPADGFTMLQAMRVGQQIQKAGRALSALGQILTDIDNP